MIVTNPKSEDELAKCVDMYIALNDPTFIKINRDFCIENIVKHWKSLGYIRLLKDNHKIVAWIMAIPAMSKHSREKYLMQEYYCSHLEGFSSVRAIKILHNDLIKYASNNRYNLIVSTGSHMDPTFVFTRILEKQGWNRRGHIATYRIESPIVSNS
jgi:hypothetical protein